MTTLRSIEVGTALAEIGKPQPVSFDVCSRPVPHKVRYWSDAINESYFLVDVSADAGFRIGVLQRFDIGKIRVCTLEADPWLAHRQLAHVRQESQDFYLVEIPLQTPLGLRQRGRDILVQPGDFAFVNSTESYTFAQHQKNQVQTIRIPCQALRDRLPCADDWTVKTCFAAQPAASLFLDFFASYCRLAQDLPTAARDRAEGHLLDLFVLGLTASDELSDETAVRIAHRQRALQTIERNFRNPGLEPSDIALAVGLSERYLQKIFSDRSETISAIIRRRRVSEAKTLLAARRGRRLSVTQIAYAVGFSDAAYFSRVFRKETGVPPAHYNGKGYEVPGAQL